MLKEEQESRNIPVYEKLDYYRIFDVDTERTDITRRWGVCLVRDTRDSEIMIEYYPFCDDGTKCDFAAGYYLVDVLEGYYSRKRRGGSSVSMPHDRRRVIEWIDYKDIIEDIKNYLGSN